MSEALKSLAILREEMKAKRAEIDRQCRSIFESEAKKIFEAHPKLQSWRWTQYTPYFNDGDECTFSANTDYGWIKRDGDEEESEDVSFSVESKDKDVAAIGRLMHEFEDDDYKFMFGDHCEVTASRNGVEVNEYSHD